MTERINRKKLIIETAGELFIEQGFEATPVRQIAECAGMTEAALYYHFKDGKRGLLKAVFESHMPDLHEALNTCREAETLEEMIIQYGTVMTRIAPQRVHKMRWFISEFPNLDESERALFHSKIIALHDELANIMGKYGLDEGSAHDTAWLLICATFGYGQMFVAMKTAEVADFPPNIMIEALARKLACG